MLEFKIHWCWTFSTPTQGTLLTNLARAIIKGVQTIKVFHLENIAIATSEKKLIKVFLRKEQSYVSLDFVDSYLNSRACGGHSSFLLIHYRLMKVLMNFFLLSGHVDPRYPYAIWFLKFPFPLIKLLFLKNNNNKVESNYELIPKLHFPWEFFSNFSVHQIYYYVFFFSVGWHSHYSALKKILDSILTKRLRNM